MDKLNMGSLLSRIAERLPSSLEPLFSTVAQVSFALIGFAAVAFALNDDVRRYWLENPRRRITVLLTFELIIFPGIVSLGGLVQPFPEAVVPAWPIASTIITIFFFFTTLPWVNRMKKLPGGKKFTIRFFSSGISYEGYLLHESTEKCGLLSGERKSLVLFVFFSVNSRIILPL